MLFLLLHVFPRGRAHLMLAYSPKPLPFRVLKMLQSGQSLIFEVNCQTISRIRGFTAFFRPFRDVISYPPTRIVLYNQMVVHPLVRAIPPELSCVTHGPFISDKLVD